VFCWVIRRYLPTYANGELADGPVRRMVERHLSVCRRCAEEVAAFGRLRQWVGEARVSAEHPEPPSWQSIEAMIAAHGAVPRRARPTRRLWRGLAFAGAAVVVIAAGVWLSNKHLGAAQERTRATVAQERGPLVEAVPEHTPLPRRLNDMAEGQAEPAPRPAEQASSVVRAPAARPSEAVLTDMAREAFRGAPGVAPSLAGDLTVVLTSNALTGRAEAAVSNDESSLVIDT
jgi:hypothetical protein